MKSKRVDVKLEDGQVVRTRDGNVEVVEEETGRVVRHWSVDHDSEVRVDGVRVPKSGEVENR